MKVFDDQSTEIDLKKVYSIGNVNLFFEAVRKQNNHHNNDAKGDTPPITVCYFGDHLQYDVAIPKRYPYYPYSHFSHNLSSDISDGIQ